MNRNRHVDVSRGLVERIVLAVTEQMAAIRREHGANQLQLVLGPAQLFGRLLCILDR